MNGADLLVLQIYARTSLQALLHHFFVIVLHDDDDGAGLRVRKLNRR